MLQLTATGKLLSEITRLHLGANAPSPVRRDVEQLVELPPALSSVLTVIRKAEAAASERIPREAPGEVVGMGEVYERAATDGELLDDGVAQLLDALHMPEDAVFADLGSGRGGALFRIAAATRVRQCIGIEFIASKHEAAASTLLELRDVLQTPISLLRGDIIDMGSWARSAVAGAAGDGDGDGGDGGVEGALAPPSIDCVAATGSGDDVTAPSLEEIFGELSATTHAFTCSVCFDDFLLRKIAATLGDRQAFPRLQALVSLRSLPSQPHFVRIGTLPLTCTWATSSECGQASSHPPGFSSCEIVPLPQFNPTACNAPLRVRRFCLRSRARVRAIRLGQSAGGR